MIDDVRLCKWNGGKPCNEVLRHSSRGHNFLRSLLRIQSKIMELFHQE
jgi:hypothetical protein